MRKCVRTCACVCVRMRARACAHVRIGASVRIYGLVRLAHVASQPQSGLRKVWEGGGDFEFKRAVSPPIFIYRFFHYRLLYLS